LKKAKYYKFIFNVLEARAGTDFAGVPYLRMQMYGTAFKANELMYSLTKDHSCGELTVTGTLEQCIELLEEFGFTGCIKLLVETF
jgi:hypothetical protein